jgi:uncharacterized protein YyaL (SSP411 family)
MNNLKNSLSPYLQEHKNDPVNWHPYDEFSLKKSKEEEKPIFLSIGYSACHWCHIMREESFEDKEIANILNENFIPIKVDREERQDIDQIYIQFLFLSLGRAGWPLNVFLTPHLKPFYGETYLPKEYFKDVILKISEFWRRDKNSIIKKAEEIFEEIKNYNIKKIKTIDLNITEKAFQFYKNVFDYNYGGFYKAPKFPMCPSLKFLLDYYKLKKDEEALEMVLFTLKMILKGGIYDHIGGGFHRYSVDQEWKIPHFEKMIYDQLLLIDLYLDLYQITKEDYFKEIIKDTLNFILEEMVSEGGGLISAIDADSLNEEGKKEEGAFYKWEEEEIYEILGKEKGGLFFENYGSKDGVLYKKGENQIKEILNILKEKRNKRSKPKKDDKLITAYQGLGISSFSKAGSQLNEKKYLNFAKGLKNFVLDNLLDNDGLLKRYKREKRTEGKGFLEDYAFFISGLLDLYFSTEDKEDLKLAKEFIEKQNKLFYDEKTNTYFNTYYEDVLYKTRDDFEASIPMASAISLINFLKLRKITKSEEYQKIINGTLDFYSDLINTNPLSMPTLLSFFIRKKIIY